MTAHIDSRIAGRIRLVSLDVDGVLTDGSLWIGVGEDGAGSELRRFHVLDGMAIRLLQQAGLTVAFVSGKRSAAVAARAAELDIEDVSLGDPDGKLPALAGMLAGRGWAWSALAHLADDLADLAVLERAGLPAAVSNAVPEVRARASWVGSVPGGSGAVREFTEALLRARGDWEGLVREFREGGRFAGEAPAEVEESREGEAR